MRKNGHTASETNICGLENRSARDYSSMKLNTSVSIMMMNCLAPYRTSSSEYPPANRR